MNVETVRRPRRRTLTDKQVAALPRRGARRSPSKSATCGAAGYCGRSALKLIGPRTAAQQLRQLGDVGRDPARFVTGEQLRYRPSPRLVLRNRRAPVLAG